MEQKYIDRFWKKVNKTNYCWEWTGAINGNGYGDLYTGKRIETVHRISWKIHYGNIPNKLWVLHRCDNRKCVNPYHLFLGTVQDNVTDMMNKGRNVNKSGEEHGFSKLTWKIVHKIRELRNSENPIHRKARKFTIYRLAEMFGISKSTVSYIIQNKYWKE